LKEVTYHAPAPRGLEIGAGVVLALFSVALVCVGLVAGYRIASGDEISTAVAWVATVFLGVGALAGPVAARLLTGRGRRGSEALLSRGAIRLGGVMFMVAPVVALLTGPWHLFHLLGSFSMAAACFTLAARREGVADPEGQHVQQARPDS